MVITPRYLVLFRNIILDKGSQSPSMIAKLESMTLANETMDDSLVLMKASEDEDFNLLSEKEVLTQIEDHSETPDTDPRKKNLRDVKSQIRAILSVLPISRALRHGSLMDVLRAESMVSFLFLFAFSLSMLLILGVCLFQAISVFETRELVTQVAEVTRLLRLVEEPYRQGNYGLLYDELIQVAPQLC